MTVSNACGGFLKNKWLKLFSFSNLLLSYVVYKKRPLLTYLPTFYYQCRQFDPVAWFIASSLLVSCDFFCHLGNIQVLLDSCWRIVLGTWSNFISVSVFLLEYSINPKNLRYRFGTECSVSIHIYSGEWSVLTLNSYDTCSPLPTLLCLG